MQGAAAALVWTGGFAWLFDETDKARRARVIGTALAAAVAGTLAGPLVGLAADNLGRSSVFAAFAALALALAATITATRSESTRRGDKPRWPPIRALATRDILLSIWLLVLAGALLGLLTVLIPLRLSHLGWGGTAIGLLFIAAAGASIVTNPLLGRWTDRSGHRHTAQICLGLSAASTLILPWAQERLFYGLAAFAAIVASSLLWTPALASLAEACEATIGFSIGLALMNAAWAPGAAIGSALGGALAAATTDATPFTLIAALCLATLILIGRPTRVSRPSASTPPASAPSD
jgi:predicted MFS family arabinose efflux permease